MITWPDTWPEDTEEEFVFTNNTSLITRETIEDAMVA